MKPVMSKEGTLHYLAGQRLVNQIVLKEVRQQTLGQRLRSLDQLYLLGIGLG